MILKYTVLILVLIKISLSYKQYKYHELCSGSKFKSIFDKITNNKPQVKLGQGVESAALIQYRLNGTNYKRINSCEFDVKVDSDSGNGIFVSIKNLKLRKTLDSYGEDTCLDYIRFTYKNGTSTIPICGHIETTVYNNLIRNFFDETSGELRVDIFISTNYLLTSETIVVDLVFTAYSNCTWPHSTQAQCSPEKCISDEFVDDKILNCPPPGCSDESDCENDEKPQVVLVKSGSYDSSSLANNIYFRICLFIIVIVVVPTFIGILCSRRKKKAATNSQRPNYRVEELRPDLGSYLEFQDVRRVPTQQPHMPEEQHERHMPLIPPEQRYDSSMPSAPPSGIRDDPPSYDTLFSAPNNRGNV